MSLITGIACCCSIALITDVCCCCSLSLITGVVYSFSMPPITDVGCYCSLSLITGVVYSFNMPPITDVGCYCSLSLITGIVYCCPQTCATFLTLLHQQLNSAVLCAGGDTRYCSALQTSDSATRLASEQCDWNDIALLVNEQVSLLAVQHNRAQEKVDSYQDIYIKSMA